VDAEDGPEPDGLDFHPHDILYAFELAANHYDAKGSHEKRLHNRWDVALSIFDRACMESDRGERILELTNRVDQLESELAQYRKGPYGLG
jgi:hypothetical protein